MRHRVAGRKLNVDSSHRVALLRSLTLALIEKETIKTFPSRAKEMRWYADRVITLAKRGDIAARRHIVKLLGSSENVAGGPNRVRTAVDKLYTTYVPRFKTRPGGYTRIVRLVKRRFGDNSEMCIIQYLPSDDQGKKAEPKAKKAAKVAKPAKEAKQAKTAKAAQDKPAKAKKKETDKE